VKINANIGNAVSSSIEEEVEKNGVGDPLGRRTVNDSPRSQHSTDARVDLRNSPVPIGTVRSIRR